MWNGLVHVKSEEWADMKELYPGRAFLAYVVERIHNEDLYNIAEMSEEDQDWYIRAAQDAHKAKLDAGVAKTSSEHFTQGTVKHEIAAICNRLQYLHAATSIECLLFVVKGRAQDGLAPTYHASDKAHTFLESHLKAPVVHLLDLMESSLIGGTAGAAVTLVAEDGSPPMMTDPLDIGMVEYKNYINFVKENKVIMEGWLVKADGSLADPSSMGLGKLEKLLKLLEDPNSGCSFKRLTENEWKEWSEKIDQDVEAGKVKLLTCKTRSDAGKKRKHEPIEGEGETDGSRPARKQNTKSKPKKAPTPKAGGSWATKQKKSSASNRSSLGDSLQETYPDATSDHSPHVTTPNRHTGAHDVTPTDPHANAHTDLPPPSEILQRSPPVDSTSSTQSTFDFRMVDVFPAALQWPTNTHPQLLTPQTGHVGLNPSGAGVQGSPRPGPSTPQRPFHFVLSTPEQQAARANSP
ncbi:hypothetical protein FRC11_006045 [Ceratobasidium sp. 423]|nr:hypothetical protein FRC11_006045 [Ceratobasidium sp. 423]